MKIDYTTTKRFNALVVTIVLALTAVMLTGCGKSEFTMRENTEKKMEIYAENADKDAFFMVGTLEVGEGEQVMIAGNLTKGEIKVEIVQEDEEQTMDKLPDLNGGAIITANISTTDKMSGGVPAGSYGVRATCLEKASGTVSIEVISDKD